MTAMASSLASLWHGHWHGSAVGTWCVRQLQRQALTLLASAHVANGRHAKAAALMEEALKAQNIEPALIQFDGNSVKARFADTDTQIKSEPGVHVIDCPVDYSENDFILITELKRRSALV